VASADQPTCGRAGFEKLFPFAGRSPDCANSEMSSAQRLGPAQEHRSEKLAQVLLIVAALIVANFLKPFKRNSI
jgi:hypothetical protein